MGDGEEPFDVGNGGFEEIRDFTKVNGVGDGEDSTFWVDMVTQSVSWILWKSERVGLGLGWRCLLRPLMGMGYERENMTYVLQQFIYLLN